MYIKEKGYTLIELIVVVALLLGLTTVMVLNGTGSRRVVHLNNAALQLESALTKAQALGHSGQAFPPGDASTEAFDRGYGVYLERDSGQVIIYGGQGDASAAEERYSNASQNFEVFTFSGGVQVSNIAFSDPPPTTQRLHVLFRRGETEAHIHGHPVAPPFNNRNSVTITLSTGSGAQTISKRVIINKTGLIYIDN